MPVISGVSRALIQAKKASFGLADIVELGLVPSIRKTQIRTFSMAEPLPGSRCLFMFAIAAFRRYAKLSGGHWCDGDGPLSCYHV